MQTWLRNGLALGIAAGITTAVVNGLSALTRPTNICQPNANGTVFSVLGMVLFIALAAIAGWRTTHAGLPLSSAALSGLIVGAISGVVVLLVVLLSLGNAERAARCITTSSGTPIGAASVLRFAALVFGVVLGLVGLGIGAGAAAVGGMVGERRQAV